MFNSNKAIINSIRGSLCAVTLSLACTTAVAETNKPPDPKSVKLGSELYVEYCQSCHQKDGVGEPLIPWGIRHPQYNPVMALNETSHAWHHSDEQLVSTILKGGRRMPAWEKVLSKKNAQDLVAYIKSLWSPRILACQGPKHMSCMQH